MNIIDTHTHDYFSQFDDTRKQMFEDSTKAGVVAKIQIGCNEMTSLAALETAKNFRGNFATLGVHPCDTASFFEPGHERYPLQGFENYQDQCQTLESLMEFFGDIYEKNKNLVVGFGEVGFDRYHDERPELVEWQAKSLKLHFELCQKYQKPVVIHTRNSTPELLDFLDQNSQFFRGDNPVRGVVHCFSENGGIAKILSEKYNFFLGFGGVITYKNTEEIAEALQKVSVEKILTETDAPFLAPKDFRKKNKINSSASLPEIIQKISEIRKESVEVLSEKFIENAQNLFGQLL